MPRRCSHMHSQGRSRHYPQEDFMGIFSKIINELSQQLKAQQPTQQKPGPTAQQPRAESASGLSWGEKMPREENQYSYPGEYYEYFAMIFARDFPSLRAEQAGRFMGNDDRAVRYGRPQPKRRVATVFTLWDGSRKALVVELLSEHAQTTKLRNDCDRQGIPYLRFYYNHRGWWNTRSYVVERVRQALLSAPAQAGASSRVIASARPQPMSGGPVPASPKTSGQTISVAKAVPEQTASPYPPARPVDRDKPLPRTTYTPPHLRPEMQARAAQRTSPRPAPLPISYGIRMPQEPNQFNFPRPYNEYFAQVFAEQFAQYRVSEEPVFKRGLPPRPADPRQRTAPRPAQQRIATLYSFYAASGKRVLVVEVMSEKSRSHAVQRLCERENIGYLRFYYDHAGWWNTRAYVVARVKSALFGA